MATAQHRRCRSITSLIKAQRAAAQNGLLGEMTVLSIMATAYQVRWGALQQRVKSHPEEAKQLDEHGRTVLSKVISRRMDDYPDHSTVGALVDANPAAVWEGVVDLYNRNATAAAAAAVGGAANAAAVANPLRPRQEESFTNSPLIVAAWKRAPLEVLQVLVAARPSIPSLDVAALVALWNSYRELYNSEQELLSLLFDGGREAFAVFAKLHCLLSYCSTPSQIMDNNQWHGRCLHKAAFASVCSVQLFQVILQKFPEQIRQRDEHGRLPLHNLMLRSGGNNKNKKWGLSELESKYERLKILLEVHPMALMETDFDGRLPLHLGILSGWPILQLMELVETCPQSLAVMDAVTGLYPFQLAAQEDVSVTSIFRLLLASPDVVTSSIPTALPKVARLRDDIVEPTLILTPATPTPAITMKSKKESSVSEDVKALLQYVLAMDDNKLWKELQNLLQSSSTTSEDWYALHAAVSLAECPMGFIRVLLHMHPEQLLRQQDSQYGRTPLHCAAANAAKSLLATTPFAMEDDNTTAAAATTATALNNNAGTNNNTTVMAEASSTTTEVDLRTIRLVAVLEANPLAAQMRDHAGQLPLHIAAYHGMPTACLEALIRAWPDALCQRDDQHSLYPFLLAACSPVTSLNDVFLLLLRAPHVLGASGVVQ